MWEAAMFVSLIGEIYDVRRWYGFIWHNIITNFHDDRFRHLSNTIIITATIWIAVVSVLLIEGIYK
jgi:tetrahydromethanopterin S-methyltransferase subunit D